MSEEENTYSEGDYEEAEGDGKATKNLPLPFSDAPTLREPAYTSNTPTDEEVLESDMAWCNNQLKALHYGYSQVRSITALCKLNSAVIDTVKHRRALLKKSYGTEGKSSKTFTISPID